MPRVYLSDTDRLCANIGSWVKGHTSCKQRREIAEEIGKTPQTVWVKCRRNTFTYRDMVTIFDVLKTPDEDILDLFRKRR